MKEFSTLNFQKIYKRGIIKGTLQEFKMWQEIIKYTGWRIFIRQTFLFAKDKIFF